MVHKYLGLTHKYGKIDCLELIKLFYKNELLLEFETPTYKHSRKWMKQFSPSDVDEWAVRCFKKVNWTDAEDYDVIVFKSNDSTLIIHFGLYLKPLKMLHVEEGGVSCIQTLSDYWMNRIHATYRHESFVR